MSKTIQVEYYKEFLCIQHKMIIKKSTLLCFIVYVQTQNPGNWKLHMYLFVFLNTKLSTFRAPLSHF